MGRASGSAPSVLCNRDEFLDGSVELLLTRALEPRAQDVQDLRLRTAVDEDDEAEAELLLVDLVQIGELGQHDRVRVVSLFDGRAGRQFLRADRRIRVERLELVALAQV